MATYQAYKSTSVSQLNSWLSGGNTVVFQESGTWTLNYPGSNTGAINLGTNAKITKAANVGEVILKMGTRGWTAASSTTERGMICAVNASNITIENITIHGNNYTSTGAIDKSNLGGSSNLTVAFTGCTNVTINNCKFTLSMSDFIRARKCNKVTITNCTATYAGHEFLYSLYSNDIIFVNNNVITRTNSAIRLSGGCNKATICGNILDGNVSYESTYGTSSGPLIEIDVGEMSSYPTDAIHIRNNVFKNARGAGIWVFSNVAGISVTKNVFIYDNTFTNVGNYSYKYSNGKISTWEYTEAAINTWQLRELYIERNSFTQCGLPTAQAAVKVYAWKAAASGNTNIYFRSNTGISSIQNPYSSHKIINSGSNYTTKTSCGNSTPVTPPPDTPVTSVTPVVSITTSKTALVQPSGGTLNSANITWSAKGCTIASIITTRWSGTDWLISDFRQIALSGGAASGVYATSPTATSRYTINGAYETVIPSRHAAASCEIGVTTEVVPAPTCVSFYASKTNIPNTEKISLIAVGLANITSASVDVETNTGVITNYPMTISGTTATASNVGFINTGTSACTLKLVGPGGTNSVQYKIYVTVTPPPALVTPSLTFTASYTEIVEDDEIELTWSTTNATNFYIKVNSVGTLDIGGNVLSGSKRVSLNETTTFEAHAVNTSTAETKETVKSITVTVYPRVAHVPIIRLQTDTQTIDIDQTARIYWTAENTTTLVCNQGVGNLNNVSGYIDVSPVATTTYTFTADGPDGAANVGITITVIQSDIISLFVVSPTTINSGESATLAWMSRYGKDAYIDNGIGLVTETARGTHIVSPTSDTTYTLTISGSMGVLNKTCDVTVVEAIPSGSISAAFSIDNPLINVGETATISWIASNTDVMACGQDIGFVSVPSGSLPVAPIVYTDYEFVLVKDTDSFEYNIPIYVVDDYVLLNPTNPTYEQTYIDMTGKRIYVSGGQSTSDTRYTWDIDTNASMRPNPDNEMITFAYDENGYYMITLTSINRDGETLKQTVRANVLNE